MSLGTWDIKHIQDKPFMALGSMLNAYAKINEGKGITEEELLKVTETFFKKACELAKSNLVVNGSEGDKDNRELEFK